MDAQHDAWEDQIKICWVILGIYSWNFKGAYETLVSKLDTHTQTIPISTGFARSLMMLEKPTRAYSIQSKQLGLDSVPDQLYYMLKLLILSGKQWFLLLTTSENFAPVFPDHPFFFVWQLW